MSDNLSNKALLEGLVNILTEKEVISEKAKSKDHQRFMAMVYDYQTNGGKASPAIKKAAKSISKKEAKKFASTKHAGLPEKVKKEDVVADEDWEHYLKSKRKNSSRHSLDNPWNHMHKSRSGRHYRQRFTREEAGVGTITAQNSTCDVNKSTPQKNLQAFHLEEMIDDMYNTLSESGVKKLSNTAKKSVKGMVTTPAANNNAGDAYKSYRFGLALAGAPEYPTKAVNEIGGDPLLSTYTDEEWEMIQYAGKQANVGPIKRLSSKRSDELSDTYKVSPVAKIKKNQYGV